MALFTAASVGGVFIIIIMFFVLSGVLYGTWNYTIPILTRSINGPTQPAFTNISYVDSMVFMVLIWTILAPGAIINGVWSFAGALFGASNGKRMNASSYNLNPALSPMQAKPLAPAPKASPLASTWNRRSM